MILLPANSIDFKNLANVVVDEHQSSGKSIEDCIVEAANKDDLTPEEIKRLVEKTNTELALRHLRGDNKKDSFALAKYDSVLSRTHGDGNEEASAKVEKTAGELPITRVRKSSDSFFSQKFDKIACTEVPTIDSTEFYLLKKEYESAKQEKVATEIRLRDNLAKLVQDLQKREAPSFDKFASDAVSWYGREVVPILDHINAALGSKGLTKEAVEIHTGIVDDTGPYMSRFEDICRDALVHIKQAEELEQLEKLFTASKKAIQRAARC